MTDRPPRLPRAADDREVVRPPLPEPLPVAVQDSHCHIDICGEEDGLTVEDALAMAAGVGIDGIVQVGVDVASSEWSVEAAARFPRVLATVALHPNEAPRIHADHGAAALDAAIARIDELAAHPRVRAIGETGLDFFRTEDHGREPQEYSFRRHIDIAKRTGKALVIHDRDAHDDVVRVLLDEGAPDRVVFHCFSGDDRLARIAAENGWYCSFAGTVTFKNAKGIREGLAVLPTELVLVETDAPFLTPHPYRGQPNASYLIPYIVRHMADVRGASVESLCTALAANTARVFGSFDE